MNTTTTKILALFLWILAYPLQMLAQEAYLGNFKSFETVDAFHEGRGTTYPYPIEFKEVDVRTEGTSRYKLFAPAKQNKLRKVAYFQQDTVLMVNSSNYSKNGQHFTKADTIIGIKIFLLDRNPDVQAAAMAGGAFMFGLVGAVVMGAATNENAKGVRLYVVAPRYKRCFVIEPNSIKVLLRGHDDLIERWHANPSVATTYEVFGEFEKRRAEG